MSFERPNGPTFFGDKDTLPTGNAGKVIKGSEVDADFNAISGEVNNIGTQVDNIYNEQVRQAVVIENHENRLDDIEAGVTSGGTEVNDRLDAVEQRMSDAEQKISDAEQKISDLEDFESTANGRLNVAEQKISDLEDFESAQLVSNQNVYDQLITHSLQIEALQNASFEALNASNTFEEFRQRMTAVLSQMIVNSKNSTFERPER